MTESYAPPSISAELGRQGIGSGGERNVFARGPGTGVMEAIDGVPVAALAQEFGTPLFVFSERGLREKAAAARRAFTSRLDAVSFAWSYKTNYLDAICQVFRSEGWIADVAGDFEYEKARRLGYAGSELVVNGPHKPRALIERAITEGALLQIDNWDELRLVEEVAASAPRRVDVGLRLCVDAGIKPVWTKFGFMLESGEAARAARRVTSNPKLRLHTLHAHIGTYILQPEAYGVAARKILALRDAIERESGQLAPCLNLGGGFPSLSLLHGMAGPAEQAVRPVEDYADAIAGAIARLPPRRRPLLRLETGRHLVDEAGYLVTRVSAVKGARIAPAQDGDLAGLALKEAFLRGQEPRAGYILDAGIHLLYTAAWFRIEASPAQRGAGEPAPSRLYGPLCMAIDVVRENVDLPPLEAGDLLTLHPVGAYNSNQAMQFIHYRPAIVMVGTDGAPMLIKERETLEALVQGERLPGRLRRG